MSTRVTLRMPEQAARILRDPRRLAHLNALLKRAGIPQVIRVDVEHDPDIDGGLTGCAVATALEVGQRVRLVSMMIEDPYPIPVGATGKITRVFICNDWVQYDIDWDPPNEKRTLHAICPPDILEVID